MKSSADPHIAYRPSPASHPEFWDTILNGLLRGKVLAVVNMLENAGWKHAKSGTDDSGDTQARVSMFSTGYSGLALTNVEKVVGAAAQMLEQCPAIHGNWDIRGNEWILFRAQVARSLENLRTFAEGKNRHLKESAAFNASSFSGSARKAESQVPWDIYQRLLTLYNIILGQSNSIIANAQDWCDASIGLLAWWDEGREDRRVAPLGQSQFRATSRVTDAKIYMRKLRRSFELATSPDSSNLAVNSTRPVEIGLASLFEGDNEAVVTLLRAWSGPISSAMAEVANIAGWLPAAKQQDLLDMDEEDMMVLDQSAPSPSKADSAKDQALISYAKSVAHRGDLQAGSIIRDGWQISIALFGRLDVPERSKYLIGEFLKGFPLDSSATVDRLWKLLNDVGMQDHAQSVADVSGISLFYA